jgi:hypothetical protein
MQRQLLFFAHTPSFLPSFIPAGLANRFVQRIILMPINRGDPRTVTHSLVEHCEQPHLHEPNK